MAISAWIRSVLALVALSVLAWELWTLAELVAFLGKPASGPGIPYNALVARATDLVVEQSRAVANFTVIFMGVLAGLWLTKKDEPRLVWERRLWPEIVLFTTGFVLLGAALFCYREYMSALALAFEAGGLAASPDMVTIPDVFDGNYEALRSEQLRLLMSGTTFTGLAVLYVRLQGISRVSS